MKRINVELALLALAVMIERAHDRVTARHGSLSSSAAVVVAASSLLMVLTEDMSLLRTVGSRAVSTEYIRRCSEVSWVYWGPFMTTTLFDECLAAS